LYIEQESNAETQSRKAAKSYLRLCALASLRWVFPAWFRLVRVRSTFRSGRSAKENGHRRSSVVRVTWRCGTS